MVTVWVPVVGGGVGVGAGTPLEELPPPPPHETSSEIPITKTITEVRTRCLCVLFNPSNKAAGMVRNIKARCPRSYLLCFEQQRWQAAQ